MKLPSFAPLLPVLALVLGLGLLPPRAAEAQSAPAPVAAPTLAPAMPMLKPALTPPASQDPTAALLKALEDDKARAKLIEALKASQNGTAMTGTATSAGTSNETTESTENPAIIDTSIARIVGEYTQDVAAQISTLTQRSLLGIRGLFDGTYEVNWTNLGDILEQLAIVVAAVSVLNFIFRVVARSLKKLIARKAKTQAGWAFATSWVLAIVVDMGQVALAWGGTFIFALLVGQGRLPLVQSLFLNAFLLNETVLVVLRAFFRPRFPELRPIAAETATARAWDRRTFWLISFLCYGVLLLVPIVNMTISFVVGIAVRFVVVALGLLATLLILRRHRSEVGTGIMEMADRMEDTGQRAILSFFAKVWFALAAAYATVTFFVWLTRPLDAIGFMANATLVTVAAVAGAFILTGLVSSRLENGISLPDDMEEAFPSLAGRINLFVPLLEQIINGLIIIIAAFVVLNAWTIIDISTFLASPAGGQLTGRVLMALLVIFSAIIIWIVATSWVEMKLHPRGRRKPTARVRTLYSLFRNAFTIALSIVALMLSLSELGLDIAPLLAGAGVVGLAIGFGSQKLVQDIITGAFIQFENVMNEGDVVTVAGISGVVERLSIRSVGLRDMHGTYHVIPFSAVSMVSNSVRGFSYHVAEIPVGFDTDIEKAKEAMIAAFKDLRRSPAGSHIIDELDLAGLVQISNNGLMLRARIKTTPGAQWSTGVAYSERLKQQFDRFGILIPSGLNYSYATKPETEPGIARSGDPE